ncbi:MULTISPECIES: tyrosine-type recombinase/integrase [unclassified Paracoccus (in: a-proteobacteria)]|uniref:tyrosine-type recombinase/integrase n=1 Tax=unclassified Paracoccus (in: a-proteobacteria) TaxID=2688777 RepID=UPI0012B2723F|nr:MULTISPECIES: tyrosine-type recombinase/integrase [unclassified Paracoccus (in: a-proteobacteria)]UXU73664.1 tyrosine-type recombinase/integrase [Paracoccus sp. SMMA_5]UXU79553.1 tyrosine-type recombinase/integrase [Paracoccus sp. SMMA_5_TC]
MTRVKLQGINRVRKRLADGSVREHHYAGRGKGAVKFWDSASPVRVGSPEYVEAFARASRISTPAKGKFRSVILRFLESQDFSGLAQRTQSDMRKSFFHPTNGIDQKFGDAPLAAFDDPRIRRQALDWRDRIGGKVGDDRIRHLQRLVAFALDRAMIRQHHLMGIKSTYKSQRAEIFWMPEEIERFRKHAPNHVWRILAIALETGLRPGDLANLSREHIHRTPHGHRIVIWTQKRRRLASIPVTATMAELIAQTPAHQQRLIVNKAGHPYQHENYLGDAVSEWRDKLNIRSELRLYDARGTAATRLLSAGAELKEIATHMGWSIKHASEVIERYVALSPGMTDGLAEKLNRAESRTRLQTGVQTGDPKR